MHCESTSPPLTEHMCIRACSNKDKLDTGLRNICHQCAENPPLSKTMCIYACSNKLNVQVEEICNRCVVNPPLTDYMCRQCVAKPALTDRVCIHACSNTNKERFRKICDKCMNSSSPPAGLCIHTCKTHINAQSREIPLKNILSETRK